MFTSTAMQRPNDPSPSGEGENICYEVRFDQLDLLQLQSIIEISWDCPLKFVVLSDSWKSGGHGNFGCGCNNWIVLKLKKKHIQIDFYSIL